MTTTPLPFRFPAAPLRPWVGVAVWLLFLSLALTSCANEPQRPTPRVVDEGVSLQARPASPVVYQPGIDRLYRVGDSWVARRETEPRTVALSPSAQRLLLASGEGVDPFRQPAPLSQELADELARLRKLAAENREAMERMREAADALDETARELLRRNQALAEAYGKLKAAAPTPSPEGKKQSLNTNSGADAELPP
ncbi:hypothetical protein [Nibricoccus sp. IMCC34717]|uniref:hypothetical protein n=1 Tax=Nibricoccus sp. IMCC34717 TaxID=3034021 RepID=UPI00384A92BB